MREVSPEKCYYQSASSNKNVVKRIKLQLL
jgi:hypothetical protein